MREKPRSQVYLTDVPGVKNAFAGPLKDPWAISAGLEQRSTKKREVQIKTELIQARGETFEHL